MADLGYPRLDHVLLVGHSVYSPSGFKHIHKYQLFMSRMLTNPKHLEQHPSRSKSQKNKIEIEKKDRFKINILPKANA